MKQIKRRGTAHRPMYVAHTLLQMLRKAAVLRNDMLKVEEFTDNGGAIHSAERILDILGARLKYPGLSHINNLKHDPRAEFSYAAYKTYCRGGRVFIEHVSPRRAFTQAVIERIDNGAKDKVLLAFIKRHYRLVLLTSEETTRLNRINRTKMTRNRLAYAGIKIMKRVAKPKRVYKKS